MFITVSQQAFEYSITEKRVGFFGVLDLKDKR
jgi:hypothetical protein